jgi:hypothetical protein
MPMMQRESLARRLAAILVSGEWTWVTVESRTAVFLGFPGGVCGGWSCG